MLRNMGLIKAKFTRVQKRIKLADENKDVFENNNTAHII